MQLPAESTILELVGMYGRLRARVRGELGEPQLVLPTAHFFPDPYDGSPRAVQRLMLRLQQHAAIDDIPVRIGVAQGEASANQCGPGGCAPVGNDADVSESKLSLDADGWTVRLTAAELGHPVALTTAMSRALGAIFLEETRAEGALAPRPLAANQDLCAVTLGFGVLLLEGAYVYSKSCGGPSVRQMTALSAPELAVATALFAAVENVRLKPAVRASSTTQRALLKEAEAVLRGNPQLAHWVKTARTDDPSPTQALGPAKSGLFSGLFSSKRSGEDDATLEALLESGAGDEQLARFAPQAKERAASAHRNKADDELKALVAEALER